MSLVNGERGNNVKVSVSSSPPTKTKKIPSSAWSKVRGVSSAALDTSRVSITDRPTPRLTRSFSHNAIRRPKDEKKENSKPLKESPELEEPKKKFSISSEIPSSSYPNRGPLKQFTTNSARDLSREETRPSDRIKRKSSMPCKKGILLKLPSLFLNSEKLLEVNLTISDKFRKNFIHVILKNRSKKSKYSPLINSVIAEVQKRKTNKTSIYEMIILAFQQKSKNVENKDVAVSQFTTSLKKSDGCLLEMCRASLMILKKVINKKMRLEKKHADWLKNLKGEVKQLEKSVKISTFLKQFQSIKEIDYKTIILDALGPDVLIVMSTCEFNQKEFFGILSKQLNHQKKFLDMSKIQLDPWEMPVDQRAKMFPFYREAHEAFTSVNTRICFSPIWLNDQMVYAEQLKEQIPEESQPKQHLDFVKKGSQGFSKAVYRHFFKILYNQFNHQLSSEQRKKQVDTFLSYVKKQPISPSDFSATDPKAIKELQDQIKVLEDFPFYLKAFLEISDFNKWFSHNTNFEKRFSELNIKKDKDGIRLKKQSVALEIFTEDDLKTIRFVKKEYFQVEYQYQQKKGSAVKTLIWGDLQVDHYVDFNPLRKIPWSCGLKIGNFTQRRDQAILKLSQSQYDLISAEFSRVMYADAEVGADQVDEMTSNTNKETEILRDKGKERIKRN